MAIPDDGLPPGALIPPQHGGVDGPLYLRSTSGRTEIQSARITQGYVDANSNAYGWAGIDRLDILPGTFLGEHVGRYIKNYRHLGVLAGASAWALCAELTDWGGKGNGWAAEFDFMSRGHDPASLRLGVGLVFGEAQLEGQPLTYEQVRFNYGILGLPFRRNVNGVIIADNVHHDVFMTTQVPCEVFTACPPGAWQTLDGNMNLGWVFDAPTGYTLLARKDKVGYPHNYTKAAFAFQLDNGALLQFGKVVIPAAGSMQSYAMKTMSYLNVAAVLAVAFLLWQHFAK